MAKSSMQVIEQWQTVEECPNYQVSNLGQVRRSVASPYHPAGRILKTFPDKDGYRKVTLYREGKMRRRSVHRLVAGAFIGEYPESFVTNHKDGDKANNRISNLEIVSDAANRAHAVNNQLTALGDRNAMRKYPEKRTVGAAHHIARHPEIVRGEANGRAKITEDDVRGIKERLAAGESPTDIAKGLPVTRELIYQIRHGRAWQHVEINKKQSKKVANLLGLLSSRLKTLWVAIRTALSRLL